MVADRRRHSLARRAGRWLSRGILRVGRGAEDIVREHRAVPGPPDAASRATLRALRAEMSRFSRVVVWGLRRTEHTHRYIHRDFAHTLRRAGVPAVWVEDEPAARSVLEPGALVIAVNVAGRHLPARPELYYCLHNFEQPRRSAFNELPSGRVLRLQVYTAAAETADTEQWRTFVRFDRARRVLFQPWGVDLLPGEFRAPVFRARSRRVFWVGSIWDDEQGRGNRAQLEQLREVLAARRLSLAHVERAPSCVNVALVRRSRIAPAIAGRWQVDHAYLPCRVFKNLAYGQLAVTNVQVFRRILGDAFLPGESIAELVDAALRLPARAYRERVRAQQECIGAYSHAEGLRNIARAFEVA